MKAQDSIAPNNLPDIEWTLDREAHELANILDELFLDLGPEFLTKQRAVGRILEASIGVQKRSHETLDLWKGKVIQGSSPAQAHSDVPLTFLTSSGKGREVSGIQNGVCRLLGFLLNELDEVEPMQVELNVRVHFGQLFPIPQAPAMVKRRWSNDLIATEPRQAGGSPLLL